jgi:peptidyl-prolyl cis-trans isomerase D
MLKILRGGQRWLTALFVAAIGGVFVFFLGLQGPLDARQAGTLVKVGGLEFGVREFERTRAIRAQRMQQELGDQFDAAAFSDTLDQMAAREIVDRALLALEAEELGLHVAKEEIESLVLEDPGFRDEGGQFDESAFADWAQYNFGSQRAFIADRRLALLSFKMLRLLNTQPRVSEGEARQALVHQLERVRIAFVALGGEAADPDSITDEAVSEAVLGRTEELQALYDERSREFNTPEQVRARHILFSIPRDADEAKKAEVRSLAEATLERVRAGEDFAALAEELSQDPGSASEGGDLGFFGRGQMVPPFEEAAFALEAGAISELVESSFGLHIIRTEEKRDAQERAFDDVKQELGRDLLASEQAGVAARALADELTAAIEGGQSLEDAARAKELTLERSAPIGRRADGFVPSLGAAPELLSTAFTLPAGASSPRVFEVGDKLALVQVLERIDADPAEVANGLEGTQAQLLQQKRMTRSGGWINQLREQLVADGVLQVDLEPVRGS